jgi:hypothetical protein
VSAQEPFPAWIGLYEASQLGWLENENRISQLCSEPASLDACYAEMLGPLVYAFDLYAQPEPSSAAVGTLIVVATPGRGLSARFRPVGSGETMSLVPDVFLQDWGYGPYFHHTFVDRAGAWYRLPQGPWPEAAWFRHGPDGGDEMVLSIAAGDIVEMDGSGWYVERTEADALFLRPEQAGDMWCQEGDPPGVTAVAGVRHARSELQDSGGRLRVRPKYMKGC